MKILEHEELLRDERRTLTQLLTANIKQVNVYDVNPGVELGNHYHKETVEYFYVLQGTLEANGKKMWAGDLFVFYPQTPHVIKTKEYCRFMTFLTVPFDKENPDLWKI